MTRRKPKLMTYLETGRGKRIKGTTVTQAGADMFMGATGITPSRMAEVAHRWMSQEKRRTHKRERREGKFNASTE